MNDPATEDDAGRRIGLFCVGLAVAAFSAFVGWAAFALSVADFYADWCQGWAEAGGRLAGNPGLAVLVGLSAALASLGVGCMVRAVVGWRPKRRTGRHP